MNNNTYNNTKQAFCTADLFWAFVKWNISIVLCIEIRCTVFFQHKFTAPFSFVFPSFCSIIVKDGTRWHLTRLQNFTWQDWIRRPCWQTEGDLKICLKNTVIWKVLPDNESSCYRTQPFSFIVTNKSDFLSLSLYLCLIIFKPRKVYSRPP